MKLLVLVTDAYGGRGGIAQFNRDLVDALSASTECEEVVVIPRALAEHPVGVPDNIAFRSAAASGAFAFTREAGRAMRGRFDGVICGHVNLAPFAAVIARTLGVPWLLIAHGIEAWRPPARVVARYAARRATRVVAVSEFTREQFIAWSRVPSERSSVIGNCVDLGRFAPGPRRADLVARYHLHGRTVLMTIGRLAATERYKGVDEVLHSLPRLRTELPSLSYLVVGEGDDRPRLERLSSELGVADLVRFTGYVPESEKVDYIRLADVFVMPGFGEGFGIVYLEAIACGVPVVASTRDASRERITSAACGVAVDPTDGRSLRRGIRQLVAMPTRPSHADVADYSVAAFRARWQSMIVNTFAAQA